jgi:hypothetical protein
MTIRPLMPDVAMGLTRLNTEHWAVWDGDDLVPIRVEDLDDRHRRNVLHWLRQHARLMQDHERRALRGLWRSGAITGREHDRRRIALDALDPDVWLEDTRLVRRLVQLSPPPPRPFRRRRLLPARLRGGRR